MDVMIYSNTICEIGGIETFLYNLAKQLRNYYNVKILFEKCDIKQFFRISRLVDIEKIDSSKNYECDICIFGASYGGYANNINAKAYYQVIHADYRAINFKFEKYSPETKVIAISKTVKKSFEEIYGNTDVLLYNLLDEKIETKPILKLISATRLTEEKGYKRMLEFAKKLKEFGIKFRWVIFTNANIDPPFEEMQVLKPRYDIQDYIAEADYGVQLSDTEGWCYFVNECLQYGTPVIVTEFDSVYESVKDGYNGYVLNMGLSNFDVDKIVNKIPKNFDYKHKGSINDWIELLGNPTNKKIKERKVMVTIKALRNYTDLEIKREIVRDEEYQVSEERANIIIRRGFADLVAAKEELQDEVVEKKDELQVKSVENKKRANTKKR